MSTVTTHELDSGAIERYQLGTIVETTAVNPAEYGMSPDIAPASIEHVSVVDPYIERYSAAEIAEVKFAEQAANDFAADRREAGKWQREPGTAYYDSDDVSHDKKGFGDPVSRDKFFNVDLGSPAITAWRSKIPSAEALADLSDPVNTTHVTDKQGNIVEMDDDARKWLSLCTDAVGIRSRATVMADIISEISQSRSETGHDATPMRWLSVACGTALPTMQGVMEADAQAELLLADFDQGAMAATERLATEIGYDGTIDRVAKAAVGRDGINIFDKTEMTQLKEYLEANGGLADGIDLMGIFEYTGKNLGVDSADFLKTCYDLLKPGGQLVFGQMRSDRRVADFTMGVVSWPWIEMRSPAEFMEIIAEAGINPKDTRLYLPDDGVYSVGVIHKPAVLHSVA